jgi:pimeloyl-ACP methyl ester carboxylesterase
MRVDHRFFSVSGLRLHAVDYGGAGHPILLVHDVWGHGWEWRDIAGPLSLWGTVMAPELRGHGDSQWSPTGAYGTNDAATDLWTIARSLTEGPVDVVGSGWGAQVGLRMAAGAPDVVRRLALLDMPPSASAAVDRSGRPDHFDDHAAVAAAERAASARATSGMIEHLSVHSTRPGPGGGLVAKHDPAYRDGWPARDEECWEDLRKLSGPTLLVRAEYSEVIDEPQFVAMVDAVPEGRGEVIKNSGHRMAIENAPDLADLLVDFLGDGDIDEL